LWAGSKLVALGLLSIGLLLWPSWKSIGIMGALVLVAFLQRDYQGDKSKAALVLGGVLVLGALLALSLVVSRRFTSLG